MLAYLADQYIPTDITITRLIPREPTHDERLEAARNILRADYWSDVRGVCDDVKHGIARGHLTDVDAIREYIDETVDGHQRVIYTGRAIEGLLYTDHESAYVDDFGSPPEREAFENNQAWSQLMYAAMVADISDTLGDLDELLEQHKPDECEDCGAILEDEGINDNTRCADCHRQKIADDARPICPACSDPIEDDEDTATNDGATYHEECAPEN